MALPNSNLLVSGTGAVFIQNLAIQGNSIIATNENGNIDFVPNGSGVIGFGNVGFNIGVISTTLENQDLTLNPDGNGNILLLPYGPGNVGIGTNSPSETLDLVGTFEQQDVLTRFIRKSLPSVGTPFNGLKGYILLAKAATPTSVNMAASYVVGKIIFKNGNTTTESFTEVFNVASSRGYDKENFSIGIEHNGYGSGNSRFNRLVKCTYDSVEYHAIETSSVGSSNSHEQTFEGYAVDAGLLFVDENYVIAVSDYGNIGIVSNGDSNIGVGTVSTTAHFDIGTNDDGRIQAILTRGNDVDFQLQAINSSSSNASGSIVSKFGVRHGTNESALFNFIRGNFGNDGSLAIVTDNAERMRINSSGNVGIGISSPVAKLDIGGSNTNGRALQLRSGDSLNDTDSAQIIFSFNNSSYDNGGHAHSIRTRHNATAASGNAIDFWLWNYGVDSANSLGSLRVMTLDGTGNVGIGTSNPQANLHVEGNFHVGAYEGNNEGKGIFFRNNLGYGTSSPMNVSITTKDWDGAGTSSATPDGLNIAGGSGVGIHTGSNTFNVSNVRLFVHGNGDVGIGTMSPATKLDVAGTIRHQGLTLNEGTTPNVDEIKTFTKTLSISTSWIDTGIVGTDLSDGSYIIQVFDNINTGLGHYSMTFTGIMSWFSSNVTGDTAYNEILLHNAGHAINGNPLFLRTQMQNTPGYLKLQIRCATGSGSGNFTFKFRRMI
jgi:hypothetical protein